MLVTDIRHFLNDAGEIPDDLPRPAYRILLRLSAIVAQVTKRCEGDEEIRLAHPCTRRPGRKPCTGSLYAGYLATDRSAIVWECFGCGDSGIISGWEGIDQRNHKVPVGGAKQKRNDRIVRVSNTISVSNLGGLTVFRPNDLYDFVKFQYELRRLHESRKPNSGVSMFTVHGLARAFTSFVDNIDHGLEARVRDVLAEAGLPKEAAIRGDDDAV